MPQTEGDSNPPTPARISQQTKALKHAGPDLPGVNPVPGIGEEDDLGAAVHLKLQDTALDVGGHHELVFRSY